MSKKTWIIIIALVIGVFGYILLTGNKNDANPVTTGGDPKKIVTEDHVSGSPDKKVVVMEYLDFQCPGCGRLYPTMEQLREEYKDRVTFVLRNFPLTTIHGNAMTAARAAEAAAAQNKYEVMYDQLFTTQNTWSGLTTGNAQKQFEEFAKQLGLDTAKYQQDFASEAVLNRINADRDRGNKMGVSGTPSVFVNGQKVEINGDEDVKKAIEAALTTNQTDPVNYNPPASQP